MFFTAAAVFFAGCFFFQKSVKLKDLDTPEKVIVTRKGSITDRELKKLKSADSLLIMIPGISSGDIEKNSRFLDRIRKRGGQDAAVFYDWEHTNPGRTFVAPAATNSAAAELIRLCKKLSKQCRDSVSIDIIAHSAGTVVVNKTAIQIIREKELITFRNVLLLGTALDTTENLTELKKVSDSVLNVHSAFDMVNRNINDRNGFLPALNSKKYRNIRMDRSLSGRIIRHYVFLSDNPENTLQYSDFLGKGVWPGPGPAKVEPDIDTLHRTARLIREHPRAAYNEIRKEIPSLVKKPDPDVLYYGVIIAGLLRMKSQVPSFIRLVNDKSTPVCVRKELYQAIGNMKDGRYVDFLRNAKDTDPECSEVIRDIVRSLKRERIEPVRE